MTLVDAARLSGGADQGFSTTFDSSPVGYGRLGLSLAPHLHAHRGPFRRDVRSVDSDWLVVAVVFRAPAQFVRIDRTTGREVSGNDACAAAGADVFFVDAMTSVAAKGS